MEEGRKKPLLSHNWTYDGYGGELGENPVRYHYATGKFTSPHSPNSRVLVKVSSPTVTELESATHEMELRITWKDNNTAGNLPVIDLLRKALVDNHVLNDALSRVQGVSGDLRELARKWRHKIIELGGEDPGIP